MDEELKRAFENLVTLLTENNEGVDRRFTALDQRLQQFDQRLQHIEERQERMEARITTIDLTLAGINRSLDQLHKGVSTILGTQTAQQRVIDDLAARVKRLEDERKAS